MIDDGNNYFAAGFLAMPCWVSRLFGKFRLAGLHHGSDIYLGMIRMNLSRITAESNCRDSN